MFEARQQGKRALNVSTIFHISKIINAFWVQLISYYLDLVLGEETVVCGDDDVPYNTALSAFAPGQTS